MTQSDPLQIICGDALIELRKLPSGSVHCCVTSPPYWGLRDYSTNGQLGLEKTPEEYVAKMVEVFREVRRVLRKDGTLWLNLGDSYASDFKGSGGPSEKQLSNAGSRYEMNQRLNHGLKPKDLVGIPWRVAFALQADGWWLRSDIIWAKPNPMPESVTDRPTKSHEYLFLLTKSANYFYDAEAIKEPQDPASLERLKRGWNADGMRGYPNGPQNHLKNYFQKSDDEISQIGGRNKRSVWTVATAPYPEAHFATYPSDLIKPCILAGTSAKGCCAKCGSPWERIVEQTGQSTYAKIKGDRSWREMSAIANEYGTTPSRPNSGQTRFENGTQPHFDPAPSKTVGWQPTRLRQGYGVQACKCEEHAVIPATILDPFAGSGTTGMVALELGRKAVLIELNPRYVDLIRQRCDVTPGLALA